MTNTKKLATLGLLTALVIVLQLFVVIKIGFFSLSTVLIPIVVGAAIFGPSAGAWLGLVFGMAVLLSGDATFFMGLNAPGTIILVLAKGIAAGAVAGLLYKKSPLAACASAPIVNTLVFILGCLVFYDYDLKYIIITFVGINFIIEFIFNLAMSYVVTRLIRIYANLG